MSLASEAMFQAGAARYVGSLREAGVSRSEIRNRLMRQFPGQTNRDYETVLDQSYRYSEAARSMHLMPQDRALRSADVRPPRAGCTSWRYHVYVDYTDPLTGRSGTVGASVDSPSSMSLNDVRDALSGMWDEVMIGTRSRFGSKDTPQGSLMGDVHVLAVERTC